MQNKEEFTFIDLFSGIGGFHLAMHQLGGKCVFASEMDEHARITYEHNFKKIAPELFYSGNFNSDIRKAMPTKIPDFDVLCAGFPCQPFSQAGYKRGFNDNHHSERGNLFFNIAEILEAKKPKAFFLENVRGIVTHDKGNTFKVIRNILEQELGYSFYYQIVRASDYGLPQLRPRAFMIGFRDEAFMRGFIFPTKKPLKYTMSDVWGGECSREIGFTLRVGGRGSKIDDRRNWDAYLVDGVVKQLTPKEGKKMQGFPDDFDFPVSKTQAIKQLGNSVAVDAVREVGSQMIKYMKSLDAKNNTMKKTNNKGEWTELLVFIRLLVEQRLQLANADLSPNSIVFNIEKITNNNLESEFLLLDKSKIRIVNQRTREKKELIISEVLTPELLEKLLQTIKLGKGTFEIPDFQIIQDQLGISIVKGGTSKQKTDIVLDIFTKEWNKPNEGFSIKSYLGNKPTLLNASGNTNFVFQIENLDSTVIDEVNNINTRTKLMDRINVILEKGGRFKYIGAERENMEYNLKLVDSLMPQIVGHILLAFYKNRISSIKDIVDFIHKEGKLNADIDYSDKESLILKIQKLLVDILLGFFAGTKWDGSYESNGTIVMKKSGEMVGFHIIDVKSLREYLYHNIKLDTPSTTRHRFGQLYIEKNSKLYFKLNLQMRF